jgi:tetratricopeptide (TPR) repeat protein/transcriptional regulator with XRE-family HTH domain
MEDGRAAFGTLLRHFRLEAGLSQEALAQRARMSIQTIGALERGVRRTPYHETVALLSVALGLGAGDRVRLEAAAARPQRPRRRPTLDVAKEGALAPPWWTPSVILDPEAIRETPTFTGRDRELQVIANLLDGGSRTVVYGLGGMGKSSIAREFAWRHRERYALIAWLSAETEDGIIAGFIRLGAQFVPGLEEITDRRRAAERGKTALLDVAASLRKPMLVIFDNVASRQLLREWAPRDGAHALATSRNADWGGDATAMPLAPWPPGDAAHYLRRESGRDLTDDDARAIAEALGGLPLALAHAAAYLGRLRTVTARKYLAQIERHMTRAPAGAEYPQAVLATFQEALERAERTQPGAAALLALAAFLAPDAIPETLFASLPDDATNAAGLRPRLPNDVSAADLASIVGDAGRRDEALAALDRFSLVRFVERTRTFDVHRLVQAAARDLLGAARFSWAECAAAHVNAVFPVDVDDLANWPGCAALVSHALAALDALPQDTASLCAAELTQRCAYYLFTRAGFTEAEGLYLRALAIREARLGPMHLDVAETLDALATLLRAKTRYAKAEALYRRALAIVEAARGPTHPTLVDMLSSLALTLVLVSRFAEAEPLYRRALAIAETTLGTDHVEVAEVLHGLGLLLRETNELAAAESSYLRALAIYEARVGPDHFQVARLLNGFALLLARTSRAAEAESAYHRALRINEACYGPHFPEVARTLNNLGNLLRDSGRFEEAEPVYRRALAIYEARQSSDNAAAVLANLATLLSRTSQYAEAEALYRRALDIQTLHLGPEHTRLATTLNNLATLLNSTGRPEEAEPLLRRALAIREAHFAPDHPLVAETRSELAKVRRTAGSDVR